MGTQEGLEEFKGQLRASEAERLSLARTQEFLEGKVADLRKEVDEVSQGVAVQSVAASWALVSRVSPEILLELVCCWQLLAACLELFLVQRRLRHRVRHGCNFFFEGVLIHSRTNSRLLYGRVVTVSTQHSQQQVYAS